MTSQWVMTLLGMPHYGTTMFNIIAKDIHYEPLLLCITTPNYDIAVSPVNTLKLYT